MHFLDKMELIPFGFFGLPLEPAYSRRYSSHQCIVKYLWSLATQVSVGGEHTHAHT